ncbi:MAG: response regulator, partial [Bacteroidota bacterium]
MVIEDSPEDFASLQRAARKINLKVHLELFEDGDSALDYLLDHGQDRAAWPQFILLDLNLPGTDGREVLHELKAHPHLRSIPVLVLTTSTNPRDIGDSYRHGANCYLAKPVRFEEMVHMLRLIQAFWLGTVVLPTRDPAPARHLSV